MPFFLSSKYDATFASARVSAENDVPNMISVFRPLSDYSNLNGCFLIVKLYVHQNANFILYYVKQHNFCKCQN